MKFEKVYLAWVRDCNDHNFFYLEGNEKVYFAWKAEWFGTTSREQWMNFCGIVLNESTLPEPDFQHGSALQIYLHIRTIKSAMFTNCELNINGIIWETEERK